MQPTTAKQQNETPGCATVAIHPQGEILLPPKYAANFTDFAGLHKTVLPFFSERSLREAIRKGVIPSITLPNGRKKLFFLPSVIAALRRFQTGGQPL